MSCCAICTSSRGPFTSQPLGRDNAIVQVCAACDEPVFTRVYPDRGWQPSGGLLNRDEVTAGARRAMGDDEYERQCGLDELNGRTPMHGEFDEERDIVNDFVRESFRRQRTGAWSRNAKVNR